MEDIKLSIQESINKYTRNLVYLAKENELLVRDLMLLIVVDDLFDWASWMSESQTNQLYLQNFRKDIIKNNPDIINYRTSTNIFYKNVSTPQTIWTWQRVYDNFNVITADTLDSAETFFVVTRLGDPVITKQGDNIIY